MQKLGPVRYFWYNAYDCQSHDAIEQKFGDCTFNDDNSTFVTQDGKRYWYTLIHVENHLPLIETIMFYEVEIEAVELRNTNTCYLGADCEAVGIGCNNENCPRHQY